MRLSFFPLPLLAISLLPAKSQAALLAYDGFNIGTGGYTASGGYADPTAGSSDALVWDADTSTGGSVGQAPVIAGFASSGWAQSGTTNQSSTVYPRVQAQTTSYLTPAGQLLKSANGEIDLFRSSGAAAAKAFTRNLSVSSLASSGFSSTLYMSGTITLSSTVVSTSITSGSIKNDLSDSRRFSMTIGANGAVTIATGGSAAGNFTTSTAAGTVIAGQTLFFVMKLEDASVTGAGDRLTLFLNPTDLSLESLNASSLVGTTSTSNFFVYNNASYGLSDLTFASSPGIGDNTIFDEFRIGNTWQDVAPFTLIPEPATSALAAIGTLALLRRRRA